ncbi:anaerobic benzoate catabolism transcriptional regulator [Chlamydia trachomatis]|nr:anaerobic benzoate catabolism transcriptional regulator [Chlamydia trachomatis]
MVMQIDSTVHNEQVLMREELGDVLREYRQRQGRTLREVSSQARVSLGYLSEVERGQKEASSELLDSIAAALNVPLSHVLRLVADRMDIAQGRPTPAMRHAAMREQALREQERRNKENLGKDMGEKQIREEFIQIPDSIPEAMIQRELAAMLRR